jgi:hypothetical protein
MQNILSQDDHALLACMVADEVTLNADPDEYVEFYCHTQENMADYNTVATLVGQDMLDLTELEYYYNDYHYEVYSQGYTSDELIALAIDTGAIESLEDFLSDEEDPVYT